MSLEQDASILAKSSQASVDALGLPSDEFSEVSPTQEQVSETPAEPSFENLEAFQDADCKINGNAMASSMNDSSEVIPVEKNVFYNQETLKYMRIIDKYKRLDVADIELPRLVIAGAQSSGKSSLLENLTGLPVPITKGMGTRFPIEINLIEDPEKFQITSSIIPSRKDGRHLSDADVTRMHRLYNQPMTQVEFEDLLREVSSVFGVPPPVFARDTAPEANANTTNLRQISSHTLQIEMKGPDFKSLSFVDTPGLFQSASKDQAATSVEEIELLVESLVGEKRTVIVAVMDATQETIHQKIFSFVDDVDPEGERTLGVMTKCDLVPTAEKDIDAHESAIKRAKNQERVLKTHGWYMVKNRLTSEARQNVSLEAARAKEAKMFQDKEWAPSQTGLQQARMGIDSLRTGLSNVFCAHIRTEFPVFNRQTRTKLATKRADLERLGPARSVISEQRLYLKSIVAAYQKPKQECLSDDYRSYEGFGTNPKTLLRRLASHKKSKLRDPLESSGIVWQFKTPTPNIDTDSDSAAEQTNFGYTKNIYSWINHRYQTTKSRSLPGLVPYPLIERLFEEQTANWAGITSKFVQDVEMELKNAVNYCLRNSCHNTEILVALEKVVLDAVKAKLGRFLSFCLNLIKDEQNGMQVIASEKQFVKDIREARTLRFMSAIARLEYESYLTQSVTPFRAGGLFGGLNTASTSTKPAGGGLFRNSSTTMTGNVDATSSGTQSTGPGLFSGGSQFGTSTATTTKPTTSLFSEANSTTSQPTTGLFSQQSSSKDSDSPKTFKSLVDFTKDNQSKLQEVITHDRQLVYEIHDILKAYYSTSVQHYADSVCKNGLNQLFIEETLDVFSDKLVDSLPDSEVERISAESPQDRRRRRTLKDDIEKLELAISESEAILREPLMSA